MYKELFKNENFTLLSIGGFISSIGDYLYNIGVTVYIYSLTKSVGAVALMWLSRGVLRIPMLYLSGLIADSYNKKRVVMVTNLVSVIFAFLFIFINEQRLWLVYILAFILQSLNDIDVSSETAILPELVSKEELSYSNSIFSFLQSTSVFLSPAIGGVLYKLYGSNILFTINAISFLIAGVLFSLIKYDFIKSDKAATRSGIIKSGIEGYKIFSRYSSVKTVFIIMSMFAVLGRFYETYKVAVSDILLNLNPEGIIYFSYALALGGLSVPFMVKVLSKKNHITLFTLSTVIIGISYIIFGYSQSFIITFGILIILGLAQNLQGIYSSTIIQNSIPKEYLGRVFSFYKILLTLFAILGLLIATPLYNLIGIGNSFTSIAVILIILCILNLKRSFSRDVDEVLDISEI
ncbi:MAG: MFS transporter [Clostridium sulfidigenes]|uniref:MFS transporter n=1 Tax=Clostridium sulfidigenes TaxID=318464 RepID=A0A927ZJC8_9CLOT|nr:MFS transporter [Clostridium sulfidigenes]